MRLADQLVWVFVVLTPLVMAGTIALSARRRRTVLQLALGVAVTMAALRRLVLLFEEDLLDLVRIETNRPAVAVTFDAFLDPLLTGARWVAVIALLVALVALLTGPYPWATSFCGWIARTVRRGAAVVSAKAQDEDTAAWAAANLDALRLAGVAVGVALLWFIDLTWGRFLAVLIVIGLYELGIAVLAQRAGVDELDDEDTDDEDTDVQVPSA